MFQKIREPYNLIPLLLIAGLSLLLFLTARPEAKIRAGSWLYEEKQGRLLPVARTGTETGVSILDNRPGFLKLKLQKPAVTLWAAQQTVVVKDRFPSSLLRIFQGHGAGKNARPFLKQIQGKAPRLRPWIYPVLLLFALLFLIKKPVWKTAAAVILGAFLFLYCIQTVTVPGQQVQGIRRIR